MSKEISTSNTLIEIKQEDGLNIVKGLGMLVELYADNLKELSHDAKIHGNILECELIAIENTMKKTESVINTLNFFHDLFVFI